MISLTADSGFTDYLTARRYPCKRDFRSEYRTISFPVRGRQALQLRCIVYGTSVPVSQQPVKGGQVGERPELLKKKEKRLSECERKDSLYLIINYKHFFFLSSVFKNLGPALVKRIQVTYARDPKDA